MIESRYKIEYVLPEDEKYKPSSLRYFWYLLILLAVLLFVTMITYDFSLSEISSDSKKLAAKAKVAIFNLEERKVATTDLQSSKALDSVKLIKKPIDNPNKAILENLTNKQQEQLQTIQQQIDKNVELSENLRKLSAKLVLEQTKNETLNVRLSEQEKDRIELEEQLNQVLEEASDNKTKLEELTIQKNKISNLTAKKKNQEQNKHIIKNNKVKSESVALDQSNTDKIIETMSSIAANNDKNNKIVEIKKVELNKTVAKQQVVENKEENDNIADIEKISKTKLAPSKPSITIQAKASSAKTSSVENEAPKDDIAAINYQPSNKVIEPEQTNPVKTSTANTKEAETNTTPKKKAQQEQNSSVDDIIAAMQGLQQSNNSTTNNNIDKDLEEDIKQQLVEQGDVAIDE